MHGCLQEVHGALAWLEGLWLAPYWGLPASSPRLECLAVVNMLQLCLGFLIPTALVVRGEARMFCSYKARCPGPVRAEDVHTRLWRRAWDCGWVPIQSPGWLPLVLVSLQLTSACWAVALCLAQIQR